METFNPYAPPETHPPGAGASETKKRQWLRHLAMASFLLLVIDALGFVVLFGYAEFPSSPESSA
jgi:hypothetical protein